MGALHITITPTPRIATDVKPATYKGTELLGTRHAPVVQSIESKQYLFFA